MRKKTIPKRLSASVLNKLRRPGPFKEQRKAILISVEDQKSSRYYFESFREELKAHRVVVVAEHQGSDPKSVVTAAKNERDRRKALADQDQADAFDEIWVVFDTEGPQNVARMEKARHAIEQARELDFMRAVSNPCFEFWILLHFEWCVETFADCRAVLNKLKKKHIRDYDKGYNPFEDTRSCVNQAIERAARVFRERHAYTDQHPCDCHPSTGVHKLIKSLLGNA